MCVTSVSFDHIVINSSHHTCMFVPAQVWLIEYDINTIGLFRFINYVNRVSMKTILQSYLYHLRMCFCSTCVHVVYGQRLSRRGLNICMLSNSFYILRTNYTTPGHANSISTIGIPQATRCQHIFHNKNTVLVAV